MVPHGALTEAAITVPCRTNIGENLKGLLSEPSSPYQIPRVRMKDRPKDEELAGSLSADFIKTVLNRDFPADYSQGKRVNEYRTESVDNRTSALLDASAANTILKNVEIKCSTSELDDCDSLLNRFSIGGSRRSSFSSITKSSRSFELSQPLDHELELRFNTPSGAGASSPVRHEDLLSAALIIECCCQEAHGCIHRLTADLVSSCPENSPFKCQLPTNFDADQSDMFGNSPLHMAAKWGGSYAVFAFLLSIGADPHAVNSAGRTFLHLIDPTALLKEPDFFFMLLDRLRNYGFRFDLRDECGKTFLHCLLQRSEWIPLLGPIFIENLLAKVVTRRTLWTLIHARDNLGTNIPMLLHGRSTSLIKVHDRRLMVASREYHAILSKYYLPASKYKCAELLCSKSCIIDQQYYLHYSQLFRSQCDDGTSNTLHQLAHLPLCPSRAEGSLELTNPCRERCTWIDHMVDGGVDVNGYDDRGQTPLMAFVVDFGSNRDGSDDEADIKAHIQHLIKRGADVNRRHRRGETALHKAVQRGLKDTTNLLIDRGANIHARTNDGQSVLAMGFKSLETLKAKSDVRYARVMACMITITRRGAIAHPKIQQERGFSPSLTWNWASDLRGIHEDFEPMLGVDYPSTWNELELS
jgi:ankyrin repeat protein